MLNRIRLATLTDLEQCYQMCLDFYQASGYIWLPDTKSGKQFLQACIQENQRLVLVYEDSKGHPIGLLIAVATNHPFLGILIANEILWWVRPDHRSRQSHLLIEAYEYWAVEKMKCDIVCVTSTDDPRLESFYKRRGYTVKEHTFYKGVI